MELVINFLDKQMTVDGVTAPFDFAASPDLVAIRWSDKARGGKGEGFIERSVGESAGFTDKKQIKGYLKAWEGAVAAKLEADRAAVAAAEEAVKEDAETHAHLSGVQRLRDAGARENAIKTLLEGRRGKVADLRRLAAFMATEAGELRERAREVAADKARLIKEIEVPDADALVMLDRSVEELNKGASNSEMKGKAYEAEAVSVEGLLPETEALLEKATNERREAEDALDLGDGA